MLEHVSVPLVEFLFVPRAFRERKRDGRKLLSFPVGKIISLAANTRVFLTLKTSVSILVLQRYGLQVTEVMPSDLGHYLGHLLNARDSCEGSGLIPTTSVYSFDSDSRNFLLCSA